MLYSFFTSRTHLPGWEWWLVTIIWQSKLRHKNPLILPLTLQILIWGCILYPSTIVTCQFSFLLIHTGREEPQLFYLVWWTNDFRSCHADLVALQFARDLKLGYPFLKVVSHGMEHLVVDLQNVDHFSDMLSLHGGRMRARQAIAVLFTMLASWYADFLSERLLIGHSSLNFPIHSHMNGVDWHLMAIKTIFNLLHLRREQWNFAFVDLNFRLLFSALFSAQQTVVDLFF